MDVGDRGGTALSLDSFPNLFSSVSLKRKASAMEQSQGMDVSIALGCRNSLEDDRNKRSVVGEMDFFSVEKAAMELDPKIPATSLTIKNEDLTVNTGLNLLTTNTGSDQSIVDDGMSPKEGDKECKSELAALQLELGRMNDENQRLRGMLNQVTTNYKTLESHLYTMMHQRQQKIPIPTSQEANGAGKAEVKIGVPIPRQFMDLGPTAGPDADETSNSSTEVGSGGERSSSAANKDSIPFDNDRSSNAREDSPENSSQAWGPGKKPKLAAPTKSAEQTPEATMRKARVSVRARSEAPMISDGCQWRKYGQKMAKGNPCPRAYYRCTMAAGCPVRKQVQRCADDRSILTTTYEGNHNHPLPPAAMAMASTTSAAASMLLSGSLPSTDGMMNPNFLARTILPCSSSMATISASAPFPTVTLDLTQSAKPLQIQTTPTAQFSVPAQPAIPLPQVFGQPLYNQSKFAGLQMSMPESDPTQIPRPQSVQQQPPSLADTVNAATAAITADPNFTAALAAAITSIIGGGGAHQQRNNNSSGGANPAAAAAPGSSNFPAIREENN